MSSAAARKKEKEAAAAAAVAAANAAIVQHEKEEEIIATNTRFYEQEFPDVDECVVVQVDDVTDLGAYVHLLEYGNIEGMIPLSELSRRRIRSVNKHIKVGRLEHVIVVRVDPQTGYIDLSKRRVTPDDVVKCEERYNRAKGVNSIIYHVAQQTGKSMLDINEKVTWPLARAYKTAYEGLRLAMTDESILTNLGVEEDVLAILKSDIKKRLTPTAAKIRADIEVSCFTIEGIDAIRDALIAGLQSEGTDQVPIRINLVAPPHYVMLATTMDKDLALSVFDKSIQAISESIKAKGGKLNIKVAPRATTTSEERELQKELENLAAENEEIDGDAEEDEEDYSDIGSRKRSAGAGIGQDEVAPTE